MLAHFIFGLAMPTMPSRIKKRVADRKAQEQREREASSAASDASSAAPPASTGTNRPNENAAQSASNDESLLLHVSPVGIRSGGSGAGSGAGSGGERNGEDALHILPSFSGEEGAPASAAAPHHLIGMTDDNNNNNDDDDDDDDEGESPVERAIREARRTVTAGTDDAAVGRAIREAQKQTQTQQLQQEQPEKPVERPSEAYVSDDDDDDGDDDDDDDDDDDALRKVYGDGGGTAATGNDNDSQGSAPSSDPDDGDALERIIAESDDDDEAEEGNNNGDGNDAVTSDNHDFISRASDAVLAEVESAVEDGGGGFDDAGWRMAAGDAGGGSDAAPPQPQSGTPRQVQHLQRIRSRKNSAGDDAVGVPLMPPAPPTTQTATASAPPSTDQPGMMLPEVLTTMRQKIESLTLFDSDMIGLAQMGTGGGGVGSAGGDGLTTGYYASEEAKAEIRRSFQQSISAAVLVSLAHKRYERRRLAAMEIEKVVRGLVQQGELDRVRAILLLLSDDYVRSTSEDARKGGVVALAASAIGLKKAEESAPEVVECRDLILASVVHACQDHSQRVRYYATESLFNVVKVLPSLAVQHFFILFEILRSLYADVDLDVRSGAELLDKKLKEVIVGAINAGNFSADACVPLFARFVHMKNKPTKRLTLTWLHEFVEKLLGAPILEFLHLFLGDVFTMVADPNQSIRDLALSFLQSVLPKLLENNEDFEDGSSARVDFDKILQSLVTTMEHPDPFVRKVAMLWMTRIVHAHIGDPSQNEDELLGRGSSDEAGNSGAPAARPSQNLTAASISVRNALPHVLPGILLSIGDTYQSRQGTSAKEPFPPEQTTHALAEQTNAALQDAVRRDGAAYVPHLDGFIYALHEELDTGVAGRNPPAIERRPYRLDVKSDGSGIESTGWFRASTGTYDDRDDAIMMSRLCALEWIIVLYDHVVPDSLKAEYACEFINPIIHQLVYEPPESIVFKSFEVLAKITVAVEGEKDAVGVSPEMMEAERVEETDVSFDPMSESSAAFALGILDSSQRNCKSRDRQVFAQLIHLHSRNHHLLSKLSTVIEYMCTLQPPEFVFVSLALELDRYVSQRVVRRQNIIATASAASDEREMRRENGAFARDIEFVSSFVQQMNNVLLNSAEAAQLRESLKNCIGLEVKGDQGERRARLFHILIHAFAHNLVATLSLCIWCGAYLTASTFLHQTDPLDLNLICYLEVDEFVELLERPLFRHLHLLMLECDEEESQEGSGAMLFHTLRSLLMLIPQSTSYTVLKDRLLTVSRFRQSAIHMSQAVQSSTIEGTRTEVFVRQIKQTRTLHCDSRWRMVRAESLEAVDVDIVDALVPSLEDVDGEAKKRRDLLGYKNEEDEVATQKRIRQYLNPRVHCVGEEGKYDEFATLDRNGDGSDTLNTTGLKEKDEAGEIQEDEEGKGQEGSDQQQWKEYWALTGDRNGEPTSGENQQSVVGSS